MHKKIGYQYIVWLRVLENLTEHDIYITLCVTDVSSELLEQLPELKEKVDALAAAREEVISKFCFETIEDCEIIYTIANASYTIQFDSSLYICQYSWNRTISVIIVCDYI